MRAERLAGALILVTAIAAVVSCSSSPRSLETVAAYVDDSAITSTVKSRMAEDRMLDSQAITVETSNGNVAISGVARSSIEKSTAESIAIKVRGVKSLQNNIVVKP